MSAFKEQVADDLVNIFFNADEFAEEHELNGTRCLCIVEGESTEEKFIRSRSYNGYEGIHGVGVKVYVEERLLPEIPVEGMRFDLDGEILLVDSCTREAGMLTIVLHGHDT